MNALTRLKSLFVGLLAGASNTAEADAPALKSSYASLNELNEVLSEQGRLAKLKKEQATTGSRLKEEIAGLDSQRIELLTDALVGSDQETSATESAQQSAEASAIAGKIAEKQRQLDDVDQVIASLTRKINGLNERRDNLRRLYLRDLGMFLDSVFKELAVEYNQKAAELSEVCFQIAAVQQVMMLYKTGNSNGFDRRVYLPLIVPGNANPATPFIDGDSRAFHEGAGRYQGAIQEQFSAAGFNFRFD